MERWRLDRIKKEQKCVITLGFLLIQRGDVAIISKDKGN
jgi:hypothetical protein